MVRIRRERADSIESTAPLMAETPIEVASLSKPVFAFAVVSAANRRELDLDAPLPRWCPPPYRHWQRRQEDDFDDAQLENVTARRILSHQGGLPNWSRDRPLSFIAAPGHEWSYSGEGYVLLQRALERAWREPLEEFAQGLALGPLGMSHSTYDPARASGRAVGHDRRGEPVESTVDRPVAATSLLSTASDYARFVRHLTMAPKDDPIVSAMVTPQVDVDTGRNLSWGLGVALAEPEWFFHWGANPGFRSLFVGSRRRGEAVLVLTDGDGGMKAATAAVRQSFGDLPLLDFPMLYPDD
ncbi:MAG TPA: serine hydrolase domain-containing protein [Polyangiaceae bacterium]